MKFNGKSKVVGYAKIRKSSSKNSLNGTIFSNHQQISMDCSTSQKEQNGKTNSIYDEIIREMSSQENQYINELLSSFTNTSKAKKTKSHSRSNSQNHLFSKSLGDGKKFRDMQPQELSEQINYRNSTDISNPPNKTNKQIQKFIEKMSNETNHTNLLQLQENEEYPDSSQNFLEYLDNYIENLVTKKPKNLGQKKKKDQSEQCFLGKKQQYITTDVLNDMIKNVEYNMLHQINKLKKKQKKTSEKYNEVVEHLQCLRKDFALEKNENKKLKKIIKQFQENFYSVSKCRQENKNPLYSDISNLNRSNNKYYYYR